VILSKNGKDGRTDENAFRGGDFIGAHTLRVVDSTSQRLAALVIMSIGHEGKKHNLI